MDKCNLPFIERDEEGYPLNFWHPMRMGDYAEDCITGRQYAEALMGQEPCGILFQRIVGDIANCGQMSGVEIGFLSTVGDRLPVIELGVAR